MTERRIGNQRPRLSLLPELTDTDAGDEVIEFAERFGLVLDDWQRWVTRYVCGENPDGSRAATQAVLLVPRQSGKSAILEAIEMAALFLWDEVHVIYSAHLGKTATDHMRRINRHLQSTPDLRRQARMLTGKGDERVETHDGRILEFITRGKKTARGGSPNRVIFDEAMFLTDDQIQAMVPALSAQSMNENGSAQMVYASSAPIAESQVLHRLRNRAISDAPERMFFAEWSVDPEHADPFNRDNWYQANPGLGLRISEEWIADNELGVLSPQAFAVERLGVPIDPIGTGSGPIDLDRWSALIDGESRETSDTVRLALDAPPDRRSATFATAGRRPDGLLHVQTRLHVDNPSEVVAWARDLCAYHDNTTLIVASGSPALAWRSELEEAGVTLDVMPPAELSAALGFLVASIDTGNLRHRGSPEMANAVAGLAVRASGDVETPTRRSSSANIAPIVAAMCALYRVPTREDDRVPFAVV